MMIDSNYALQVAQLKSTNTLALTVDKTTLPVQPIPGEKDTVTLSDKALAMMKGNEIKEIAPTYVRPQTARSLLAKNELSTTDNNGNSKENAAIDNRFSEMLQNILDNRLGVDREKLEELEALMEEIANNENMSPEEKQLMLEKLAKMREQIIKEGREIQEVVKQTD